MKKKLKNLKDQVIVITGASSGIGLVTARMAAQNGARLVLASRSEQALQALSGEINHQGGQAVFIVADVSNPEDVDRIVNKAEESFGGFDTWVNNAGVSMCGKLLDEPIDDMRKLFEANVWGLVYGSLQAAKHLKEKGGAIINIGSTVSDRAFHLQGMYSSSKHAVAGFTDALRMEPRQKAHPSSLYTQASLHPILTGVALIGAGAVAAALWNRSTSGTSRRRASFRDGYRYAPKPAVRQAPVRYNPSIEQVDEDESKTIATVVDLMKSINETTFKDYGHAVRSSHAKSCGLLQGKLRVLDGLPARFTQGLSAKPAVYPIVLRLSTQPGDMLDDSVSCPRAMALKVIGVEGERLPDSERPAWL